MTHSLGRVPCVENESVGLIHGESCTLKISYDIPLQRVLIQQRFLLEQLGRLAIRGNRGFLDAQKNLNETPAQHVSLDLAFSCFDISPRVSPYWYERVMNVSQNFLC